MYAKEEKNRISLKEDFICLRVLACGQQLLERKLLTKQYLKVIMTLGTLKQINLQKLRLLCH